jgi:hypothetical protein
VTEMETAEDVAPDVAARTHSEAARAVTDVAAQATIALQFYARMSQHLVHLGAWWLSRNLGTTPRVPARSASMPSH